MSHSNPESIPLLAEDGVALETPVPFRFARAFHTGTGDHFYTIADPVRPFVPGGDSDPYSLTIMFNHDDSPLPRSVAAIGLLPFARMTPRTGWHEEYVERYVDEKPALLIRARKEGRTYRALLVQVNEDMLIHLQAPAGLLGRTDDQEEADFMTMVDSMRFVKT